MTGYQQISDHRFEGYDNQALAALVQKFQQGDAAQRFSEASFALRELAASLAEADEVLRQELGKLGIEWQGAAGENAGKTITAQADYAGEADEAARQNAKATSEQSANYSQSRNAMPEPQKLRGDTDTNFIDDVGGFFGYETDHAKEVKETQAAREQTIRNLNQYTEASRDALNQFQGMEKPPNFEVTTVSSVQTPVPSVQQPGIGVGGVPGGVGGGVPGSLAGGTAGGTVGGFPGLPGGFPGGGTVGGPQLPGGSTTGLAPLGGGVQSNPFTGPGLAKPPGSNFGLGLGLGLAAGTGLGLAATTARGARVVRGGGGLPGGGGPAGGGPAGGSAEGKGAGAKPGNVVGKPGVSATIGALEGEERAANRAAPVKSAAGKIGASSMLQPAATARGGQDEEDAEHIRKYGVDSDDVFGDERMVVQSVIGDESERK
ncbi:PPE domain-containing protein [Saccharothrix coeruleofusca]|uniref:PPE domain-containing protein n=1 Tax=Saccharothrix coeruleofusca TaxID=33919 RepID=A0A918ASV4_9PSEU|nr:PPE domain-containing protein [Saccharothrix coeruleofusca]MBP2339717.1 hypothetical protein [Saccharothrix coeruleofusca]GGP80645.1 hypothetical protein GCM10010185_63160 [Saccharothrix coeruleofusca]